MEIYSSYFTLRFKDTKIETEYNQLKFSHLKRFNLAFSVFLTVTNCVSLILVTTFDLQTLPTYNKIFHEQNIYTSVFTNSIALVLIFCLLKVKLSFNMHRVIAYYNAISSYFIFLFVRYYVSSLLKLDTSILHIIFFIEFFLRCMMIFLEILGFLETFFVSWVLLILIVAYLSPTVPWWQSSVFLFVFYLVFILLSVIFAYFMTREKRKSFYYDYINKRNIKWYENIFDKSSFGFFQITDRKIVFANRLMKTKLFKHEQSESRILSPSRQLNDINDLIQTEVNEKCDSYVRDLFNDIELGSFDENVYDPNTDFLDKIKDYYMKSQEVNFIFLGIKSFNLQNEETSYEILYRFYSNNDKENYEFILNDITKTREIEKKNAEFKYKALYLAKVAHEFKNPLICISELIEKCTDITSEVKTKLNSETTISNLEENLFVIDSLSKYLIILTKDLDYFSGNQIAGNNDLVITEVSLTNVLKFVSEVTKGLIIKSNKKGQVHYELRKDENLPDHIKADEIKLKQVLINLLSNAVKFTNIGRVILHANKEEGNKIKFLVEDTGSGIPSDKMATLFKPFTADVNSKNLLGTGLGLNIVHDITSKFESVIQFSSKLGEGSKFWFNLKTDYSRKISSPNKRIPKSKRECYDLCLENSMETIKLEALTLRIDYSSSAVNKYLQIEENKVTYNIIVADDDVFVRSSAIRILLKAGKKKNINLNIIEVDDGVEIISSVYQYSKTGMNIDIIVSDETMNFLNGSESWNLIKQKTKDNKIHPISFFLVTAYQTIHFTGIENVFNKPLSMDMANKILSVLDDKF